MYVCAGALTSYQLKGNEAMHSISLHSKTFYCFNYPITSPSLIQLFHPIVSPSLIQLFHPLSLRLKIF